MKEIRIVVTMDCEPTTATCDVSASGPGDWALGERAVLRFGPPTGPLPGLRGTGPMPRLPTGPLPRFRR